jgi:tRNA G18 (ribose-2'-O)-methylase SpoU
MKQLEYNETPKEAVKQPIKLLCDGINLSANIGSIFRICDAFRVDEIIFGGLGIDTKSRKVTRVSRSTHLLIQHRKTKDLWHEIEVLKSQNYTILALEITESSKPVHQLKISPKQKIALIIGSEMYGVSHEVLKKCHDIYHIPIYGKNSSMNVSTALGIMLYEIRRQC